MQDAGDPSQDREADVDSCRPNVSRDCHRRRWGWMGRGTCHSQEICAAARLEEDRKRRQEEGQEVEADVRLDLVSWEKLRPEGSAHGRGGRCSGHGWATALLVGCAGRARMRGGCDLLGKRCALFAVWYSQTLLVVKKSRLYNLFCTCGFSG